MTEANLSFNLLEKYLNKTVEAGLLECNDYKYNLTEHGRDFLRQYKLFEARYIKAHQILESLIVEREQLVKLFDCSSLLFNHADAVVDDR
jgi:hypothetical protein